MISIGYIQSPNLHHYFADKDHSRITKLKVKERGKKKMNRNKWTDSEIDRLKRAYKVLTIKELLLLFPDRNAESINAKIKRLKEKGEIIGNKDSEVKKIAMKQRRWVRQLRPGEFNIDPDSWRKGKLEK